jgi:uncharacterized protein (TIGR02757 family)
MNCLIDQVLEYIYDRNHQPEYIPPDPLELLAPYKRREEREIAALVVSSLSLGRAGSIVTACRDLLSRFPSLYDTVVGEGREEIERRCSSFYYRFFRGRDVAALVNAAGGVIRKYGTLENCFLSFLRHSFPKQTDESCYELPISSALSGFVTELHNAAPGIPHLLLPNPDKKSACKRLFLFLRWMVRRDTVDPGGWDGVPTDLLLVPVDTHMLRIGRCLGLTERKQGDLKTAVEITSALRAVDPNDPVRFDFSLSRLGIHPEIKLSSIAVAVNNGSWRDGRDDPRVSSDY